MLAVGYNRNFIKVDETETGVKISIGKAEYTFGEQSFNDADQLFEWFHKAVGEYRAKERLMEELSRDVYRSTWVGCVEHYDHFTMKLKCGKTIQTFKIVSKSEMKEEELKPRKSYIPIMDMEPYYKWLNTAVEKALQDRKAVAG